MIRGQTKTLKDSAKHIKKEAKVNIHNRFDIEVINAQTGEVKQKGYAENIVLDTLWKRILPPSSYFNYIHFGSGTGGLDATRTKLFSFLGAKQATSQQMSYNWSDGFVSNRKQCQLSEIEYVGEEITEVGIGYGSSSTSLVTHAFLKDMNGNAITIEKTNIDIINIYATVFLHFDPLGYDNGSVNIHPARYNRFCDLLLGDYDYDDPFNSVAAFSSFPCFTTDGGSDSNANFISLSRCDAVYSSALKKISLNNFRFGIHEGNSDEFIGIAVGHIIPLSSDILAIMPSITLQVGGEWFDKSTINGEVIGVGDGIETQFKTVHPLVKPGWKIYVDGIKQDAGVVVTEGLPFSNEHMGKYFQVIENSVRNTGSVYSVYYESVFDAKGSCNWANGTFMVAYNPFYSLGIDTIEIGRGQLYAADLLGDWIFLYEAGGSTTTFVVPEEHRTKKYWKFIATSSSCRCGPIKSNNEAIKSKNVIFEAPPSVGSIITMDYDTEVIAKDENHVFDLSLEITLGEKTE